MGGWETPSYLSAKLGIYTKSRDKPGTVPTFNSCTKCRGQPGHNTRPRARSFMRNGCMDDLTTERGFDSQATWVINVLSLYFTVLTYVRLTVAGIKCLYCRLLVFFIFPKI